MTEKERFILAEQFNGLQGVTFVKDDCADVDTYYTIDGTVDLLNKLSDENEQLKSDNNRLVNQTAKIVSEHQKRVLDLIDKKIREYSNLEQRERTSNDTIEILNELKKELVE